MAYKTKKEMTRDSLLNLQAISMNFMYRYWRLETRL
ncbi:hypothetical protein J2T19_004332 [Paenibacillus tundrae]|uniref:Transposase n=1 Tax=Paenibacillus tundrae TaxID=528187 RepID=A0ABT9WHV1_9BACL|nr:hypothetical protein [Paenibacillus tundrae]